jgi:RNA polymerase sigma-70 factor, ECF subfamily
VTHTLRDPHQAGDVVQETMLRAWHHAESVVPARGSVTGWLTRVAHTIAVDKMRARKTRPVEVGDARPRPLDGHASAVVEPMLVARALARLSPAHQEILRATYYADRTVGQAAEVLGLPVGTVKIRTYDALRHLKVYLEDEMSASAA